MEKGLGYRGYSKDLQKIIKKQKLQNNSLVILYQ